MTGTAVLCKVDEVRRAAVILAVGLLGGCATTREGTTWEDDAREGIAHHTRTSSAGGAMDGPRGPWTHARSGGPPRSEDELARPTNEELELALLRFATKRRSLLGRATAEGPKAWPRPVEAAFDAILSTFERALEKPAPECPRDEAPCAERTVSRRVLIQARVTLEVELDAAESRLGPAPASIAPRVPKLYAAIARQMRAIAPTTEERPRGHHPISLSWPVTPVIVTSPFGYRRDPILGRRDVRFHAGVDLGGELGEPVHASGPGRVIHAGWLGGQGRAVVIQHSGGYQTTYGHLRQVLTAVDDEVDASTPIGLVGSSGRSTGPHLHFEVRHGGAPIDPQEIVDTVRMASRED